MPRRSSDTEKKEYEMDVSDGVNEMLSVKWSFEGNQQVYYRHRYQVRSYLHLA